MEKKRKNETRNEKWMAKFGTGAYNTHCRRFRCIGERCWCSFGQEMLYCTNNCIYSTNYGLKEYQPER